MSAQLDKLDRSRFQEITRSMDEIRSGRVKTIPWQEVRRKARALLRAKAASDVGSRRRREL